MEEHNLVSKMYHKATKELESTIVQWEEKLSEKKAREDSLNSLTENLKAQLAEKSLMQSQIPELEQKLLLAEKTYIQEVLSSLLVCCNDNHRYSKLA